LIGTGQFPRVTRGSISVYARGLVLNRGDIETSRERIWASSPGLCLPTHTPPYLPGSILRPTNYFHLQVKLECGMAGLKARLLTVIPLLSTWLSTSNIHIIRINHTMTYAAGGGPFNLCLFPCCGMSLPRASSPSLFPVHLPRVHAPFARPFSLPLPQAKRGPTDRVQDSVGLHSSRFRLRRQTLARSKILHSRSPKPMRPA